MSKYGESKLKRKNTFHYKYAHLNLKTLLYFTTRLYVIYLFSHHFMSFYTSQMYSA